VRHVHETDNLIFENPSIGIFESHSLRLWRPPGPY